MIYEEQDDSKSQRECTHYYVGHTDVVVPLSVFALRGKDKGFTPTETPHFKVSGDVDHHDIARVERSVNNSIEFSEFRLSRSSHPDDEMLVRYAINWGYLWILLV